MAACCDGGALGWMVRSALLAITVYVGSNFVRSVTCALSAAAGGHGAIHFAQPAAPLPPRTSSG